jgi:hypothetical protein
MKEEVALLTYRNQYTTNLTHEEADLRRGIAVVLY